MNNSADIVVEKDIVSIVSALRAGGVETIGPCIVKAPCLSKEMGKVQDAVPHPSIRFHGGMETMLRAMPLALDVGLAVLNVGLYYSAGGGFMLGPWWEMTFTANVVWPMFASDLSA